MQKEDQQLHGDHESMLCQLKSCQILRNCTKNTRKGLPSTSLLSVPVDKSHMISCQSSMSLSLSCTVFETRHLFAKILKVTRY